MANQVSFLGYSRASGRVPFLRIYEVTFSGDAAASYAEVIDFNTALNPNGLEDAAGLTTTTPFIPPLILGSTLGGNVAELEIGAPSDAGQYGIQFYSASKTAITSGTYESAGFPANGDNFGQVLIGIQSAE